MYYNNDDHSNNTHIEALLSCPQMRSPPCKMCVY